MTYFHFAQSHGLAFAAKVRDFLGSQVVLPLSSKSRGFSLVVAFSRNNFRLTPASVGLCLQAILGGQANGFLVSQISQQVFRFFLSSKHVGFLCLDLKDFSCDGFNLGFFFDNVSGLAQASSFARKDSGPANHWELVRPRKGKAVFHQVEDPSTNHNNSMSGRSALVPNSSRMDFDHSRMDSHTFSANRHSGFESLSLDGQILPGRVSRPHNAQHLPRTTRSYADAVKANSGKFVPLTGANATPIRISQSGKSMVPNTS